MGGETVQKVTGQLREKLPLATLVGAGDPTPLGRRASVWDSQPGRGVGGRGAGRSAAPALAWTAVNCILVVFALQAAPRLAAHNGGYVSEPLSLACGPSDNRVLGELHKTYGDRLLITHRTGRTPDGEECEEYASRSVLWGTTASGRKYISWVGFRLTSPGPIAPEPGRARRPEEVDHQ